MKEAVGVAFGLLSLHHLRLQDQVLGNHPNDAPAGTIDIGDENIRVARYPS